MRLKIKRSGVKAHSIAFRLHLKSYHDGFNLRLTASDSLFGFRLDHRGVRYRLINHGSLALMP